MASGQAAKTWAFMISDLIYFKPKLVFKLLVFAWACGAAELGMAQVVGTQLDGTLLMEGTVTITTPVGLISAYVEVERITNYRSTGTSSGALRLEIWKFPDAYTGGSLSGGVVQGQYDVTSTLPGRYHISNVSPQIIYNAGNGGGSQYVLFLTEHGGGSTLTNWRVVDYLPLGSSPAGTRQAHAVGGGPPDANPGPPNDDYENSTIFPPSGGVVYGSNVNATKRTLEPLTYAGNAGGKSVWWLWTAPASGQYTVSTAGSSFDTLLAVYTRTFGFVGENDDWGLGAQSQITFQALAGTDYRIVVDGWNGASGAIVLSLAAGASVPLPAAPVFTSLPLEITLHAPDTAYIGAFTADGTPAPTFSVLSGALPPGLTLSSDGTLGGSPVQPGSYTFVVQAANGVGSATQTATVIVTGVASVSHLANLSVRSSAGKDNQTLIVGFVVSGSGAKSLLIRGIGPTLTDYGVTGALADPQLRLFDTNGQIDQNDDWGGGSQLSGLFGALGAFALPSDSKDAVLLKDLAAGVYTTHVTTSAAVAGIALIEAYDADSPGATTRLTNLSARTQVDSGAGILIAGFVVAGNAPKTLLIRGVGPSLTAYGVGGALADPKLEVYQSVNSDSTLVASNDDWAGATALQTAFGQVGAFDLASPTSKDAALLLTVEPGVYTAQVSGVNNSTGVALVEIYEVP